MATTARGADVVVASGSPRGVGRARTRCALSDRPHGSPPRAWGERRQPVREGHVHQFTPHVRGDSGKTGFGEHDCMTVDGSPPRAWGQRVRGVSGRFVRRFTPTCVGTAPMTAVPQPEVHGSPPVRGNSAARGPPTPAFAVHPHVRGDSGDRTGRRRRRPGGSPPTSVGTASTVDSIDGCRPGSPHVRGDSDVRRVGGATPAGSPPRARTWTSEERRHPLPGVRTVARS
jgi:hypothetical protein